jgi:hypothetical protein
MFKKEYDKHIERTNPEQRIGMSHELIVRDDLARKGVNNYDLKRHAETIEVNYGKTKLFYVFNGLRIIDIITDKQ